MLYPAQRSRVSCSPPLLQFHAQQLDRHQKAVQEAREIQQFHRNQMADRQNHKEAEIREEVKFNKDNVHLLQVRERGCSVQGGARASYSLCFVAQIEERQFQEYAQKVIAEAGRRGANTQPLHKAARAGAGQHLSALYIRCWIYHLQEDYIVQAQCTFIHSHCPYCFFGMPVVLL